MDGDSTSLNTASHPALIIARKLAAGDRPLCRGELELWRGVVDGFLRQQLAYATWWMRLANCEPRTADPFARVPRPRLAPTELFSLRRLWRAISERSTIRERWTT
jgi:hypothetical protein